MSASASGEGRNKRSVRNILQERATQFGLGLGLAGVAVFNAAFFGLMVWFLIDELIGRVAGLDSAVAVAEDALRAGQVETLLWAVLLSLFYGVLLFALGVVLAHRMAGPLNRVLQELGRLAAGEAPGRIRLRDTDLLRPYAEEVNDHLEQISMSRAHATVKLRGMLDQLSAAESPRPEQLRAELQELIEMLHPTVKGVGDHDSDAASVPEG